MFVPGRKVKRTIEPFQWVKCIVYFTFLKAKQLWNLHSFLLSQMFNLWHLDSLLVNHLLSMQIHRSELKLWPALPLAHVCMHMNGTKSNVPALLRLKCSCFDCHTHDFQYFSESCSTFPTLSARRLSRYLHWPSENSYSLNTIVLKSSYTSQKLWEIYKSVPSTTWGIYFRLVPAASDCYLALDEMDFAWPACHSAEAHILYGGWRMKTAQVSSACFKGVCLIVWQSVEVAEECEGL